MTASTATLGSMFSGAAGLDMAVERLFAARPVWFAENDRNACAVLAARYPDVQNLGDVTALDWDHGFGRVDILTAGYPCQPFSNAGKRRGVDDPRHLWPYVRKAIGGLRPRLVILENVQGHLTKGGLEVVGSLAELGYRSRWGLVRASDAGAPHRRARLFIVAEDPFQPSLTPVSATVPAASPEAPAGHTGFGQYTPAVRRWERVLGRPAPEPTVMEAGKPRLSPRFSEWMMGWPQGWIDVGISPSAQRKICGNGVVPQQAMLAVGVLLGLDVSVPEAAPEVLLPTPEASMSGSTPESHLARKPGRTKVTSLNIVAEYELLPTPAVNDMGANKSIEQWDEWTSRMRAKHGNGNGHGKSLSIEAQRIAEAG